MAKQYSDAEKAAYWKDKALSSAPGRVRKAANKSSYYQKKSYRVKANRSNYKKRRGFGSNFGTTFGTTVGAAMGGPVGSALGAVVGSGADALVKWVSGQGDYVIRGNSYLTGRDAVPQFTNNNRCTMISHREYITDIYSGLTYNTSSSSTNFDVQNFRINPSLPDTFPWLSALASNYEQYVVQGMIFEFKSNSGNSIGSTNTALGTVIMATQYNSLAPKFTNKQQMENHEFAQSTTPSHNCLHPIECDPSQTQCGGIFNTVTPGSGLGDRRLYDLGEFSIATQGMQGVGVCLGELWVTYKICFLKPRLTSPSDLWDHYDFDPANISGNYPFGELSAAKKAKNNSQFTTLTSGANEGYIRIDDGYTGYIAVMYTVNGGSDGNRPPLFQAALGYTGIQATPLFNSYSDSYTPIRYHNGGPLSNALTAGRGGQTFQVFRCLGGPNMTLITFNQALATSTDYAFTFASLDIISLGQYPPGDLIPFYDEPLGKQLSNLRITEEEEEPQVPEPIYEDWQVVKDRQINIAMGTPQQPRSLNATPGRPY